MIDAEIPCGAVMLEGDLRIPEDAIGLVIFVHGSGSSRLSPRNQYVARKMRDHGLATLLFDVLTEREAEARVSTTGRGCDLTQLTRRLLAAIRWARQEPALRDLPFGLFGSSTGAAAALTAASMLPDIGAVVSRGGRSDLATDRLEQVTSPTLLIAGSQDGPILQRNRESLNQLPGVGKMSIIPGAGHLFEERGTLD
ncbi:MAG: alpha/beta hydrolase, partial [Verrucomicrobiaceae bacterium]